MSYRWLCIFFVGWLALVMGVSADIVWSGAQYQRAYHDIASLDFNQDGTSDFVFDQIVDEWSNRQTWVDPTNGQIVIYYDSEGLINPHGLPLPGGTIIDVNLNPPDYAWESNKSILFGYGTSPLGEPGYFGLFVSTEDYLGVSFNVEGSTHFGWVQMSHDLDRPSPDDQYLYIRGWAWETEADTPIIAGAIPEPSTGILTMIGTLSLLQLARSRRRRKQGCTSAPRCRRPKISEEPKEW